ncbi:MAG: radical SAM protein, partial [Acidobacteriaceae bacterium]
ISTDSARRKKSRRWARWTARQCKRLFQAKPMPDLQSPQWGPAFLREDGRDAGQFAILPEG